jgi:hypothetical protein
MPGLFTHADCSEAHRLTAGSVLPLTSPTLENGVNLFRRTLYLRFDLDPRCSSITLSPQSQLELRFEPTTVNVSRSDQAWVKRWQGLGPRIDVELSYPAPILRLHSQLYDRIAVYRVDGEAVSEQATVTANAGQTLAEPLVAPHFQVELSEPNADKYAHALAERVQDAQMQSPQTLSAMATDPGMQPSFQEDLQQLQEELFAQSALGSIVLQGQPVNPRLRLLNADATEGLWQWLEPGAHSETIGFPEAGEGGLAELLAPALQRAFEQAAENDDSILLPLLIESDAPCRLVVEQAQIGCLLETELVPEAITYRLDGTSTESRTLALVPPAGLPHSLYFEAGLDLLQPLWASTPPALQPGDLTGVSLSKGDQLAVPLRITQPLQLSALALAWYGLADLCELALSLSADGGQRPAAKPLVQVALTQTQQNPLWLQFQVAEIDLQPGPYWLGLRLRQGSGIWLGQPLDPPQPAWYTKGSLPVYCESLPLQLYSGLLSSLGDADTAPQPIQLHLNANELGFASPSDNQIVGAWTDLPAALQALPEWQFTLSSAHALIFTLKTVRLRYSL